MMAMRSWSRRMFLRDAVLLGGSTLLLGACSGTPAARSGSEAGLPDIEGPTLITDRAQFPKTYKESPEFAQLVAQGKLPPVAERIGKNPLVLKPVDSVGRYGGQIRRGFIGQGDFQNAVRFCSGPDSLLFWDYKFEKVVPNIAQSFEMSDNDTVLTVRLREGMRWSDGQPFTADDVIFWYEDVSLTAELGSGSAVMRIGGKAIKVEKVDDKTVRYVSPVPNPLLPEKMAGWTDIAGMVATAHLGGGGYAPKHYLSRFHPKYTSQAGVDQAAADAGFSGWAAFYKNQASWHRNPDLPVLTPWVVTRAISNPPWEFAANPYSIWVDNEGNQLPYIGKITMGNVENTEVLGLRAASGEYDVQDRHLGVTNLPVLLENEKRGGFKIHRAPFTELDCGVRINLAYAEDQVLGDLLRTADFRRALSLGIDREQVNESFFLGTSKPSAPVAAEGSPYDLGAEWRTKWATHDPAQANKLLDKLGLTKGSDGYRVRPDGSGRIVLDYQSGTTFADYVGVGEMLKRQWQKIGIDLNVQQIDGNLSTQRAVANQLMLSGHGVGTDDPFLKGDNFLPTITNAYTGMIGIPYAQWFASDGKKGTEPPESVKGLKDAMRLYEQGLEETDEAERIRIGKELYKMHADQVWSIGIVGFGIAFNGVYLTSNKIANVPERVVNSLHVKSITNTYPMTFYYQS